MAVLNAADRGAAPLARGHVRAVRKIITPVMAGAGFLNPGEVAVFAADGKRVSRAAVVNATANNIAGIVVGDPSITDQDRWVEGQAVPIMVDGIIVPYPVNQAVGAGRKQLFVDADLGANVRGAANAGYIAVPNTYWLGAVANGSLGELEIANPWGNF